MTANSSKVRTAANTPPCDIFFRRAKMTFVLFLDILGLGRAAAFFGGQIRFPSKRAVRRRKSLFLRFPEFTRRAPNEADVWLRALVLFPLLAEHSRILLYEIDGIRPSFTALFSDCGFWAFKNWEGALRFASYIMGAGMVAMIPLRGGIGAGNLIRFRISDLQWLPQNKRGLSSQRASARIKKFMHAAFLQDKKLWKFLAKSKLDTTERFIGSAVTRAYWAESSGLKGMRIFMHPSITKFIPAEDRLKLLLPVRSSELNTLCKDSERIQHELAWPVLLLDWKTRARNVQPSEWVPFAGIDLREKTFWKIINRMEHWYDSQRSFTSHYDATYASLADTIYRLNPLQKTVPLPDS